MSLMFHDYCKTCRRESSFYGDATCGKFKCSKCGGGAHGDGQSGTFAFSVVFCAAVLVGLFFRWVAT